MRATKDVFSGICKKADVHGKRSGLLPRPRSRQYTKKDDGVCDIVQAKCGCNKSVQKIRPPSVSILKAVEKWRDRKKAQ
jgi:hypothetical protein